MTTIGEFLGDLFADDNYENNGLFQLLDVYASDSEDPILREIFSQRGTILDSDYIYFRSYSKKLSPSIVRQFNILKTRYPNKEDNEIKMLLLQTLLLPLVLNRYMNNWEKRYIAITADYNPINDYNELEENTYKSTNTDTPNTTTKTSTNTNYRQTSNVNQDNSTFAFDSSDSTPTASNVGEQTTENVGNANDNYNQTEVSGTNTSVNESSNHNTKSGKRGNSDYTTLVEKELELRKYDFYNEIYEDIDNLIALSVY